jgi:hypothetical protein
VVRSFGDARIHCARNKQNLKLPRLLTKEFSLARGDLTFPRFSTVLKSSRAASGTRSGPEEATTEEETIGLLNLAGFGRTLAWRSAVFPTLTIGGGPRFERAAVVVPVDETLTR